MTFMHKDCCVPKPKQGTCFYCGKCLLPGQQGRGMATWDHKIPISRGGAHLAANLILACQGCNGEKDALTLEEFRQFKIVMKQFHFLRKNSPARITNFRFAAELR